MDVVRVLDALAQVLPPGATASWLDPGGAQPDVAAPTSGTAALVAALAGTLDGSGLAGDGSSVLLEAPGRTLLAHRCGDGTLVVEAGRDLNLALVRRVVRAAVGELPAATAGTAGPAAAPALPVLPRRRRPDPVTEFRYEPEDLDVLDQLHRALSG